MKKSIRILAIETSCDETAAAVIGVRDGQPVILSNIVSSQIDLHAKTGGVVPEVASRAHMDAIMPVIAEALIIAKQAVIPTKAGIQESINLDSSSQASGWNDKGIDYQKAIKTIDQDITHLAVTAGPGLIGCLLVGFNAAKTLAYAKDLPIIPINHIEGHIYSAFGGGIDHLSLPITHLNEQMKNDKINDQWKMGNDQLFPLIALTVSGGHTSLTLMKDHGKYETLGETLDDAAGEAFDKVAKMLDLGYPGGPAVSKLASQFRSNYQLSISNDQINDKIANCKNDKICPSGIVFPRPIINDGTLNFSFSGLKTAVLQKVLNIKKTICIDSSSPHCAKAPRGTQATGWNDRTELSDEIKQEICAAFEDAVVDVLVTKTIRAADKFKPKTIILAGGVSANKHLRETLEYQVSSIKYRAGDTPQFLVPPMNLCGDNAAMIGLAAYYHILRGETSNWQEIKVDSNLPLSE